jgi:hypothetical protein
MSEADVLDLGPHPLVTLGRDPRPARVPEGRAALEADLGLPRRDPGAGRLGRHSLADEAIPRGGSTGFVEAFGRGSAGHDPRVVREIAFDIGDLWPYPDGPIGRNPCWSARTSCADEGGRRRLVLNRIATWAILIWTALMGVGIVAAFLGIGGDCVGLTGSALSDCQAAAWVRGGVGLTLLLLLWFVVFLPLAIVWFVSRPKENVSVFGPAGQQVIVSEDEAKKRVEQHGWMYQKPIPPNSGLSGDS